MGKRIESADGYRVEGKARPGEGTWRKTASGWSWDRMYRGERLHVSGKTQAEARKTMKAIAGRIDTGLPPRDARMTLGTWLEEWRGDILDARQSKRGPLKPTTKATYRTLLKTHVLGREADAAKKLPAIPADPISRIPLDKLKPSDITHLLARLTKNGMADSSRRQVYHIMRLALEDARRDRLIAINPMSDIDRPVVQEHEAVYLRPEDVVTLLAAAQTFRYHEVLSLIAATGMRRGEALALKRTDVDLVSGVATIRGTLARIGGELVVMSTKTKSSTRQIVLVPSIVDILARLADTQEAEKARAGSEWVETDFVFTTETGRPVDPRNVFRTMQAAAKKAKLTGVGIHTLRHSVTSGMMNAKESPKLVQGILGHSDIEMTMHYAHDNLDDQREALNRWASSIGL